MGHTRVAFWTSSGCDAATSSFLRTNHTTCIACLYTAFYDRIRLSSCWFQCFERIVSIEDEIRIVVIMDGYVCNYLYLCFLHISHRSHLPISIDIRIRDFLGDDTTYKAQTVADTVYKDLLMIVCVCVCVCVSS